MNNSANSQLKLPIVRILKEILFSVFSQYKKIILWSILFMIISIIIHHLLDEVSLLSYIEVVRRKIFLDVIFSAFFMADVLLPENLLLINIYIILIISVFTPMWIILYRSNILGRDDSCHILEPYIVYRWFIISINIVMLGLFAFSLIWIGDQVLILLTYIIGYIAAFAENGLEMLKNISWYSRDISFYMAIMIVIFIFSAPIWLAIFICCIFYVTGRIFLLFPMQAIGKGGWMIASWRMTRGNGRSILVLQILVAAAVVAILLVFQIVAELIMHNIPDQLGMSLWENAEEYALAKNWFVQTVSSSAIPSLVAAFLIYVRVSMISHIYMALAGSGKADTGPS